MLISDFFQLLSCGKSLCTHLSRVTRGGKGGGLPCPFSKIGKKCPNFEKKCRDCGHL